MKDRTTFILIILFIIFVTGGLITRRNYSKLNIELIPAMRRSPAYKSQEYNPVFKDKNTNRVPVKGTIPRGYMPLNYANTQTDRELAGKQLKNPVPLNYDSLSRGKVIFERFCYPCHGLYGAGDGPVAKRVPALSMPINTKATFNLPDGEIFHIITYGRNNMPANFSQISQTDRWKVIHYLRDLQKLNIAAQKEAGEIIQKAEPPPDIVSVDYGKKLFNKNCASCHGKEGKNPLPGIPTLNTKQSLAITDDQFYRDIITNGRRGTAMIAWGKVMTPTQIESIIKYIRSWIPPEPDRGEIVTLKGNANKGKVLFRHNCAECHGIKGEGGIGNRLNSPSFLALASDPFLRDTILKGRTHTAMPTGIEYTPQEIADLIAYIRSFSKQTHSFKDVKPLLAKASKRIGKKIFRARCVSCHSKKGRGGIGPRLNDNHYLNIISDEFLYRAITEGRPGTAMPAWRFLTKEDVADLIKYIRSWQKTKNYKFKHQVKSGRIKFGEILYNEACKSCHGKSGSGGVGVQLNNPVFLSSISDNALWELIAYGKPQTAMRGFLKGSPGGALMSLLPEEIDHIIAYLRYLEKNPPVDPPMRAHSSRSIAMGKYIYEKKAACAKCHGIQGQGASAPALASPEFLKVASDGYIIGTVILGRENTQMLSFYRGGNIRLTQEDVENVVAYVRSFENMDIDWDKVTPPSKSNIKEGRKLFLKFCAGCHGTEGKGPSGNKINGYAPSINNPDFLNAIDDGFLFATIALGREGTKMRSFAKNGGGIADLSAIEITKIVDYIRSWEVNYKKRGNNEK